MEFSLTNKQLEISNELTRLVNEKKSVLLEAVCGAGKTELVYQTIESELSKGHKVCFAIARRQVVLEIAQRLQSVFKKLKVIPVCQGYTSDIRGDLIVCTTHQLYRFHHHFDLLILDEPDAFPYKGNDTLQGLAQKSCKGVTVYLTATPDNRLVGLVANKKLAYLYLPKRPTGKDMIVPKTYYLPKTLMIIVMVIKIIELKKTNKPIILFAPTIKIGKKLYRFVRLFSSACNIDSKVENKDEIIQDFKSNKYQVCVSTTVLERGITIPSVSIIVYEADSDKYDQASLTQMAGRVGRSIKDPTGKCYFLATSRKESIDGCVQSIIKANKC